MSSPIYVKLDEFENVENILKDVRSKIEHAKSKIEELKTLRKQEEDFVVSWQKDAESVEDHLEEIYALLQSEN